MASSTYERPEWIKPDDPLFAMLSYKCIDTMIWLIRNLPRRTPRNSAGNVISLLEVCVFFGDNLLIFKSR